MLIGIDETPITVNTTVIVTCTIDRVYPALEPDDFQMTWGTQTIKSTGSQNNDKSFRYTVHKTHTVTRGNNGMVVQCFVNPRREQPNTISTTITVKTQSKTQTANTSTVPKPIR